MTIAIVVLTVATPLLVALHIAVFISSPGWTVYSQDRIGRHGEHFKIRKFRTMVRNAHSMLDTDPELRAIYLANDHKVPAELDTRITKIGHFLRRTSLDEMPQLVNVMVGHMALVGPRPVVPSELEKYGDFIPLYKSVRPGITGPWQARGRSTVPFQERVLLDKEYIENWTYWSDIVLLAQTVPAVLKRHGAH